MTKKVVAVLPTPEMRMIVVGNEVFDWGLDEEHFKIAQRVAKSDEAMKDVFLGEIQKHLVQCFSEFVGKQVTLKEISDALEKGEIEV